MECTISKKILIPGSCIKLIGAKRLFEQLALKVTNVTILGNSDPSDFYPFMSQFNSLRINKPLVFQLWPQSVLLKKLFLIGMPFETLFENIWKNCPNLETVGKVKKFF